MTNKESEILNRIKALQTELNREVDSLEKSGIIISTLHGTGDDKLVAIKIK